MNELSPLGVSQLQAWASQAFLLAFTVGVGCGLVTAGGWALGIKAVTFAKEFCWDFTHRQVVQEWEAGPEAQALRDYHDAVEQCQHEDWARAEVVRIANQLADDRAFDPSGGDPGSMENYVVLQVPEKVRGQLQRLREVKEENTYHLVNEATNL